MIRRSFALASLAASVAAAAHAQAPAPAAPPIMAPPPAGAIKLNPDVRCMLVADNLGRNKDQRAQQMAGPMMIFYLGRVDARTPKLALGPALAEQAQLLQASQLKPAQLNAMANSCVTAFQVRMQALQQLAGPRPGGAAPAGAATPAAPPTPPAQP